MTKLLKMVLAIAAVVFSGGAVAQRELPTEPYPISAALRHALELGDQDIVLVIRAGTDRPTGINAPGWSIKVAPESSIKDFEAGVELSLSLKAVKLIPQPCRDKTQYSNCTEMKKAGYKCAQVYDCDGDAKNDLRPKTVCKSLSSCP